MGKYSLSSFASGGPSPSDSAVHFFPLGFRKGIEILPRFDRALSPSTDVVSAY